MLLCVVRMEAITWWQWMMPTSISSHCGTGPSPNVDTRSPKLRSVSYSLVNLKQSKAEGAGGDRLPSGSEADMLTICLKVQT